MLKNYLKVAFRNIMRSKGYSFINITGLAVGMAVCILIFLWVQDETSFDGFHVKESRIHRVLLSEDMGGRIGHWIVNAPALAPNVIDTTPEVRAAARLKILKNRVISKGTERLYEDGFAFVDPAFFDMFSFPLVRGNAARALEDPSSILISQRMAAKYFDRENPIGKTLRVDNRLDFHITGVLRDIPANSHLTFDFAVPFQAIKEFGFEIEGWNSWAYPTYLLLGEGVDPERINEKLNVLLKKHNPETKMTLYLQPLERVHLHSAHIIGGSGGDIRFVSLFSIIALFILLMACINFMNLTTARSSRRAREVGMRKVVGARKHELVTQFFGESFLLAVLSLVLALSLVSLALPAFNDITGKRLLLDILKNPTAVLGILAITLFTGLVAGGYPAVILASIRPSHMLKTRSRGGSGGTLFRKVLVVFQFFLTVVAIIGTGVVYRQLNFIKNQRLGFDREHILCLPLKGQMNQRLDSIKHAYAGLPQVAGVTAASSLPSETSASYREEAWEGRRGDEGFLLAFSYVDHDYTETFGIEMKEGRFFTPSPNPEEQNGVVINDAAARAMGMEDPVGKRLGERERIIGVMKDTHNRSLHRSISPMKLVYRPDRSTYVFLKLHPGDITRALQKVREIWNRFAPEFPFQFRFFDEHLNDLYGVDHLIAQILGVFTWIAIFIATLGLMGLASFMTQTRTKEIGIRKALGATVTQIIVLLSKEFTRWVLLANLVAWPVAAFIGQQLLQNYAYRIGLEPAMFLLAGLLSLLIAMVSVGYQSVRAARANPIKALRYE